MMKKTLLATAVASSLALSFSAQAVNISADGTGEVLLFPYYNVNNGNTTFLSVTNTTTVTKAVKVRFREGVSSEDVFDFTLYLSPQDNWNGAVFADDSGNVKLFTADTSCTVPASSAVQAASFSSLRIASVYDPDGDGNAKEADEVQARLSEGHMEIIEMAELPTGFGIDADDIADAVKHSNGVPADCNIPIAFSSVQGASGADSSIGAILHASTQNAGTGTDPDVGATTSIGQRFNAPGGGLFGYAAVLNNDTGVYFPYNAVALVDFASTPIWWPQNGNPFINIDLDVGGGTAPVGEAAQRDNYFTADLGSAVKGPGASVLNFDLPDLSTADSFEVLALTDGTSATGAVANVFNDLAGPGVATGIFDASPGSASNGKRDAVTAALTVASVQNDYITSQNFQTDWIVTFATKHLHVGDRLDLNGDGDTNDAGEYSGFVVAPFTVVENARTGLGCETVTLTHYDREERANNIASNVGVSPGTSPGTDSLCREVNVLSLNDTSGSASAATGSISVRATTPLDFADGWMDLGLSTGHSITADNAPVVFNGLPAIGVSAVTDVTAGVQRGGTFKHRGKLSITTP